MRIGVHDRAGCALGLALGCVELGHQVVYAPPREWMVADADGLAQRLGALARHAFGGVVARIDAAACDLVVVAEVFGDFLAGFAPYLAGSRDASATPAWLLDYPQRLQQALGLATTRTRAVVIDYGDVREHRESAFEAIDGVTLLARECALDDAGPWRPFPFLFHGGVLWLQRMRPRQEWWIPPAQRCWEFDWSFCGTVEHPRYGERRAAAIAAVRARWPSLRGDVCERAPFVEVGARLQGARMCLDLPGAGELCFRLHEALSLGVPVWKPEPFGVWTAPGLDEVIDSDPEALAGLDPHCVREVADRAYSPRAAAAALFAAVGRRGAPAAACR